MVFAVFFQVKVCRHCNEWSGGISIGLTTLTINNNTPWSVLPASALDFRSKATWLVTGSQVRKCQQVISENYVASLDRLEVSKNIFKTSRMFYKQSVHIIQSRLKGTILLHQYRICHI